eukprot:sb/3473335/
MTQHEVINLIIPLQKYILFHARIRAQKEKERFTQQGAREWRQREREKRNTGTPYRSLLISLQIVPYVCEIVVVLSLLAVGVICYNTLCVSIYHPHCVRGDILHIIPLLRKGLICGNNAPLAGRVIQIHTGVIAHIRDINVLSHLELLYNNTI